MFVAPAALGDDASASSLDVIGEGGVADATSEAPLTTQVGAGTRESPFRSIREALREAHTTHKNVYVCAGRYPENIVIDPSLDGVRVYGGYDCGRWAYSTANNVVVTPSSGVPLTIKGLVVGATIEDVEWRAPMTRAASESSVAAFVGASMGVRLVRVKLIASDAQPGASIAPPPGSNYDVPVIDKTRATTNYDGHNAEGATGGAAQKCENLCKNGEHSVGGSGGNGAQSGGVAAATGGRDGEPLVTTAPSGGKGGGAQADELGSCSNGSRGANAIAAGGGEGAQHAGILSIDGWLPSTGARGSTGKPGQGGGGGGGGLWTGTPRGGGGGGGCGGCGGAGGIGGKSGGSSFALLSHQSFVTLVSCELSAGSGGDGGNGGDGQVGQTGGASGLPAAFGCSGGTGGTGAAGGSGGGGAGGLSVAIGYSGVIPVFGADTLTHVSVVAATGGAPGIAAPGAIPATDGAAGTAEIARQLLTP